MDLLRTFVKQLYDLRMSNRTGQTTTLLPELYIDNFDDEQIFQQLEIFNNHVVEEHRRAIKAVRVRSGGTATEVKNSSLASQLSKHMSGDSRPLKKQVTFESRNVPNLDADSDADEEEELEADSNVDSEEESVLQKLLDSMSDKRTAVLNSKLESDDDGDDDDDEASEAQLKSDTSDDNDSDIDNNTNVPSSRHRTMPKQKKNRVSAVDDQFFKLAEMEAFLDEQDLKEQHQHSGDADDIEDDEDYNLSTDDKVIIFSLKITSNYTVICMLRKGYTPNVAMGFL